MSIKHHHLNGELKPLFISHVTWASRKSLANSFVGFLLYREGVSTQTSSRRCLWMTCSILFTSQLTLPVSMIQLNWSFFLSSYREWRFFNVPKRSWSRAVPCDEEILIKMLVTRLRWKNLQLQSAKISLKYFAILSHSLSRTNNLIFPLSGLHNLLNRLQRRFTNSLN